MFGMTRGGRLTDSFIAAACVHPVSPDQSDQSEIRPSWESHRAVNRGSCRHDYGHPASESLRKDLR